MLSKEELAALQAALPRMTRREQEETLALLDEAERRTQIQAARTDLISFAKRVYPGYSVGAHHRWMANIFKEVLNGTKKRVIINIAPRHGKSELTSYLLPAWWLGEKPASKIMMVTHTEDLSASFGRRIRNLIDSEEYTEIFPKTSIAKDAKGSGAWSTTEEGTYYAAGVGGAIAGRGADLLIVDDPHSEQSLRANPKLTFENAWQWYQTGPRQRLQWGGAIIVVMTRWGKADLTGKLLAKAASDPLGDQWEVIEFPAILPSGKPLWPDKWPLDELEKIKATIDRQYWQSQYMQAPTSEEGALIKREWWQIWEKPDPPKVEYIIQTWDTAHDTKSSSDYSACTTWGIWYDEQKEQTNLILLNAIKGRWEFPELKEKALSEYREWEPETLLIEKKAAGAPLIQEMRRMEIVVEEYSPSRGTRAVANDKVARVNSVSPIVKDRIVWVPDKKWAHEVVSECAEFPNGEHDDYVDCTFMALKRYRDGGLISLTTDFKDKEVRAPRRSAYY